MKASFAVAVPDYVCYQCLRCSIQSRSITTFSFTYYIHSLHHHKYKWNPSHINWTRYMVIISSKIYLFQMKTSVTINSRIFLLAKTLDSTLNYNKKSKLEGADSSYVDELYISRMLGVSFYIYEMTMHFKYHHA